MTAPSREAIEALIDYLDEEADIEISSAGELTELGKILRRHEVTARALLAQRERDEKVIEEMAELLAEAVEMTGEPNCWHDHHGYCQAHNLQPRGECWVERSKALAARDAGGE